MRSFPGKRTSTLLPKVKRERSRQGSGIAVEHACVRSKFGPRSCRESIVDRSCASSQAKRLPRREFTLSWIGRPWVLRSSHRGRRTPTDKCGIRELSRRCRAVGAERGKSGLKRIRRLRMQNRNLRDDGLNSPLFFAVRPHHEMRRRHHAAPGRSLPLGFTFNF